MAIVLCIVLAFLWVIRVIDANEWLSEGALEFITIIIISVGCIAEYMLVFGIPNVYTGLVYRSLANYDEIVYQGPDTKANATTITKPIVTTSSTSSTSSASSGSQTKEQCNPEQYNSM